MIVIKGFSENNLGMLGKYVPHLKMLDCSTI